MKDVVLSIDQGTTGTTALLLDKNVQVVAHHNVEFPNHYPSPGLVEHDVAQIWESVREAVTEAIRLAGGADAIRIQAIGITNQRETCLFWDHETGEPIHRALVWQDRRTADRCQTMKSAGHESEIRAKTGLVLDPYFSGTKAAWLLDNVEGARERAERGQLLFGTIDTWVAWKLTGAHVTDPSNASRTLLFNIHDMVWDESLLSMLEVPAVTLPQVVDNAGVVGETKGVDFLPDGIPVSGLAGDQQSALFGQACFEPGTAKSTYGTGAFVLLNTGERPVPSVNGLLTTVAWRLNGVTTYALEGSSFIAGAAVQWLRDGLGIISSAAEIEELAASVPDSGGVMFVPALAGLGAPYWRPDARGLISGITGGTTGAHLARATLDGIAHQICDILTSMSNDANTPLTKLKVDGGAARNNLLMQRQADLLGVACVRPTVLETTALGSAFLAGLGVGFWDSTDAITQAWCEDRTFTPNLDSQSVTDARKMWETTVQRTENAG